MEMIKNKITVKIEGFKLEKLISTCAGEKIYFKNLISKEDMEINATIDYSDLKKLKKLAKNNYRITVIKEDGPKTIVKGLLSKKSMLVGVAIFLIFIFLQGQFISEIRIDGYEKSSEAFIRAELQKMGIYEGARKNFNIEDVKQQLYLSLGNISWVGVYMDGNLLRVSIVETDARSKDVSSLLPCDIVAGKYGMVEKVVAKNGRPCITPGSIIVPGEAGISGTYIIEDKYGDEKAATHRYVHSEGEIIARVPYRFTFFQNKYELIKEKTGKKLYGLNINIGNFKFNTFDLMTNWESCLYKEKNLIDFNRYFAFKLDIVKGEEVSLIKKLRSKESLEKEAEMLTRNELKKNNLENAQILNKSLKFTPKVNIIETGTLIEIRENIGVEEEIIVGDPTDSGNPNDNS